MGWACLLSSPAIYESRAYSTPWRMLPPEITLSQEPDPKAINKSSELAHTYNPSP